ncbi:hypothetical protein [Acidobacterium sp. S8]|uniref:hypothetical protein n=1 Tax=Acidobacterium sp. S8 TaxID=1641854 RepID=UPI00131CF55B|nr:hypothetical protein [Acidobacterium sp. S8]
MSLTRQRNVLLVCAVVLVIFCLGLLLWHLHSRTTAASAAPETAVPHTLASSSNDTSPTTLYAHNIRLHKGPNFRIYIRWIHGQMLRTHPDVTPSFDDPDSFVLEIEKGVVRANIGDVANYLNANMPSDAALKNISIVPDGDQLKLRGTAHKVISMPVELEGTLSSTPDGRVQFHVARITALKIPIKGLLGGFHIQLADLVHATNVAGVEVSGNDIIFDTQRLLPPPHIRGRLTALHVSPPDIEVIYGDASDDDAQLAKWHNFLRLNGGTLAFGKLTMQYVDLTMIDATKDPWFDLDLVNYQAQLVKGYTRMTPQAGLEIFMPNVGDQQASNQSEISLEWLRDRNRSVPADIPASVKK